MCLPSESRLQYETNHRMSKALLLFSESVNRQLRQMSNYGNIMEICYTT